jgi:transposase-like protein
MEVLSMAKRKSDSPQKAALREMMSTYMKENNVLPKNGTDVNSIMRDMMSIILEGTLDAEMDEELGYSKYDYRNKDTENSRNGYSKKTMHTSYGDMDINVPRDRKGEFEPQVVKKYQNTVTQDMEEKILSMYAKGMTTSDIESHMRELYDIDVSDTTISRITDKVLPLIKEWQERPLEEVYAVVFMDAIHYHVRSEGRIVKRAVYIAIGINMAGIKDVLGMYVGENESAKFWLSIMNGLKNRGVEDILITCVDGLTGFPQAIEAVYPNAEIQQCIIHQIRNSTKYVSYKDLKKLMADLKTVYSAPDEKTAVTNLEEFGKKWDSKYPQIHKSWSERWPTLATYFKYPEAVRRLIYTTNTIEGFNRQLRKVTKSKTVFPSDDSLLKMLYLAMMDITKKWTGHRQDWGQIHAQLEIFFEERLAGHRY